MLDQSGEHVKCNPNKKVKPRVLVLDAPRTRLPPAPDGGENFIFEEPDKYLSLPPSYRWTGDPAQEGFIKSVRMDEDIYQYGFISTVFGIDLFFHPSQVRSVELPKKGDRVLFYEVENLWRKDDGKDRCAAAITLIEKVASRNQRNFPNPYHPSNQVAQHSDEYESRGDFAYEADVPEGSYGVLPLHPSPPLNPSADPALSIPICSDLSQASPADPLTLLWVPLSSDANSFSANATGYISYDVGTQGPFPSSISSSSSSSASSLLHERLRAKPDVPSSVSQFLRVSASAKQSESVEHCSLLSPGEEGDKAVGWVVWTHGQKGYLADPTGRQWSFEAKDIDVGCHDRPSYNASLSSGASLDAYVPALGCSMDFPALAVPGVVRSSDAMSLSVGDCVSFIKGYDDIAGLIASSLRFLSVCPLNGSIHQMASVVSANTTRYFFLHEKVGDNIHEDRETEFKSLANSARGGANSIKDYATKYLNAFLNSKGGTLLLGVTDAGVACGVSMSRHHCDQARLTIDDVMKKMNPSVDPHHYQLTFVPVYERVGYGGVLVQNLYVIRVCVTVPSSDGPPPIYCTATQKVYLRRDGSVTEMPLSVIQSRTLERNAHSASSVQELVRKELLQLGLAASNNNNLFNNTKHTNPPRTATNSQRQVELAQQVAEASAASSAIQIDQATLRECMAMGFQRAAVLDAMYLLAEQRQPQTCEFVISHLVQQEEKDNREQQVNREPPEPPPFDIEGLES